MALALLGVASVAPRAQAQRRVESDRYDDIFRKYSKRYFGPGFDWRVFKAQGLAESGLDSAARSRVGARGVMQLMPSTYAEIRSNSPMLRSIDDPEWNIAAGIMHDRGLWRLWTPHVDEHGRRDFMFGSYNAGEGTILRARRTAQSRRLDDGAWTSIETVAPEVPRWRYRETLGYVRKIRDNIARLDDKGRLRPRKP